MLGLLGGSCDLVICVAWGGSPCEARTRSRAMAASTYGWLEGTKGR